jgi:hypothetical protein
MGGRLGQIRTGPRRAALLVGPNEGSQPERLASEGDAGSQQPSIDHLHTSARRTASFRMRVAHGGQYDSSEPCRSRCQLIADAVTDRVYDHSGPDGRARAERKYCLMLAV